MDSLDRWTQPPPRPAMAAERRGRSSTRAAGAQFEAQAERALERHGLSTVARNFTCRGGELDLVMIDRGTLVFVEVRYRRSSRFGSAAETIGQTKQARLLRAAQIFLLRNARYADYPCRFDVVALSGDPARPEMDWIAGAFSA